MDAFHPFYSYHMQKVLLPTDFSDNSFNAVKYALEFYADKPCHFILFNTYEMPRGSAGMLISIRDVMEKNAKEDLQLFLNRIQKLQPSKDHKFEMHSMFESFLEGVQRKVKQEGIDMVILGTQGASGLKEKLMGSNTSKIIRNLNCPIIAVPENAKFEIPKKIILATDLQEVANYKIYEPLLEMVKKYKSHLMILHAYTESDMMNKKSEIKESTKLQDYFKFVQATPHYMECENPVDGIAAFAKSNDAPLLAMVTRSHNLFDQLFNGSSVEKMSFHF